MTVMSRKVERRHQDSVGNRAIEFILSNELVLEKDNKPIITSKGEQFLHEARYSARWSDSGRSGAI